MTNPPTADLARFCASLQSEDIPTAVRERVRYLLLDHFAITIRGSILPSSLAGYQMLQQMAIGNMGPLPFLAGKNVPRPLGPR